MKLSKKYVTHTHTHTHTHHYKPTAKSYFLSSLYAYYKTNLLFSVTKDDQVFILIVVLSLHVQCFSVKPVM